VPNIGDAVARQQHRFREGCEASIQAKGPT
jgi:hypothetical protein